MNQKETPVLLLTGYLGSGKTTLLNRILYNEKGIRFAVIVNDIGEVNIDANLIQKGGVVGQADDSLVALSNGCICCTLKMDLVKQLNDLINLRQFDYIVIEASGICEPAPIAQTITTYPQMVAPGALKNGVARLDAIVTVVDALRMRDEFGLGDHLKADHDEEDLASLVIQQIEFCNIILLNKADMISTDEMAHLKANFDKVATSARWIEAMEGEEGDDHHDHHDDHDDHERHDDHDHHHHDHLENEESGEALEYGIQTFVYYRRPAMSLARFDEFVSTQWPKSVIRAKGMCYFRDEPDTCYLFEQSGKQFNITNAGQWFASMPAEELEQFMEQNPNAKNDWDENYGDRMQKIVFIGKDMDRKAIEALLDACLED